MQPISSHQLLKSIGNDAKSASDLQQWVVLVKGRDGKSDEFAVRPPVKPVSGFIGRIMQSAKDIETEQMGIAALASFRDHLVKQFGKEIGEAAGQSIRGRVATVEGMRTAMALAIDRMEALEQKQKLFETRVEGQLIQQRSDGKASVSDAGRKPLSEENRKTVMSLFTGAPLLNAKDPASIKLLASSAASMINSLETLPDATDTAIQQVLTLATWTGDLATTVQVVKDLCAPPGVSRTAFTGASVSGAQTAGFVKGDVTARGRSEIDASGLVGGRSLETASGEDEAAHDAPQLHVNLVKEISSQLAPQQLVPATTADAREVMLSGQLKTDCERCSFKVNGQAIVVTRDADDNALKDQFLTDFRAAFPQGPKGDAIARLASACMNQRSLNPMSQFSSVNHDVTALRGGTRPQVQLEAFEREDGAWSVRCSLVTEFDTYFIPSQNNQPTETPSLCASLTTVNYTIDTSGDEPRLSAIATDLVFSGKVGSETGQEVA